LTTPQSIPTAAARAEAATRAEARVDAHVEALHAMVMASLDDDQALDIVSIPLAGKTTIADYMIIASGKSGRQVASMAMKIADKCKTDFGRPARVQGLPTADWVLIDAGDVIVHIFRPEVRAFYNLERMWAFDSEPNKGEPRMGALRDAHEARDPAGLAARAATYLDARDPASPEGRDPALGDPRKAG
jgi:ribosome-associated protein